MAENNNPQDHLIEFINNAVQNNDNNIAYENAEEKKRLSDDDKKWNELIRKDKETDIDLKRHYGMSILHTLNIWVALVAFLLLLNMLPIKGFSDSVLITLLTTTTANILALPMIVIKYLFPNKK